MDPVQFRKRSETLSAAIKAKLRVRGRGLEPQLRAARRHVPMSLRSDVDVILRSLRISEHPKLARLMDVGAVESAFDSITAHLKGIDLADRRRGAILRTLGALVFNLILLAVLLLLVFEWQSRL